MDYSTYDSTVWMFDPFSRAWTDTGANLVTAVSNYYALVLKDSNGLGIYVVSGHSGPGLLNPSIQRFYPKTGISEQLTAGT